MYRRNLSSTASVLRAGLRLIGLQRCKTLSSLFLMLPQYAGQPLGFADCSVVPQPTAAQLADIAIASAETRQAIAGEAPRVAMLSFSTHGSARHPCVANVQQATEIVRQRAPQLMVDGELQFDAAFVPDVAAHKAPGSPLRGGPMCWSSHRWRRATSATKSPSGWVDIAPSGR